MRWPELCCLLVKGGAEKRIYEIDKEDIRFTGL